MATTSGLTGTSINTQFFTAGTIIATESAYVENPVVTGVADFRNVTSFDGYSPFPSGTNVGSGFPLFSALVISSGDYDYRYRGIQSTASVAAAISEPSLTLSLSGSTNFGNPTINGTLTANALTAAGQVTATSLSTASSAPIVAGSITGITLEKLDVATDASPGDLLAGTGTTYARLSGGASGDLLFADSSSPTGLSWGSSTANVAQIVSGSPAGSLVISTSSTPTYVLFSPPSTSSIPRYLRRNPSSSIPYLSWETLPTSETFPSDSSETVVVDSLSLTTMDDGLFYGRDLAPFTVARIQAPTMKALGSVDDESSATTIASVTTAKQAIRINETSFTDGAYNLYDSSVSSSPSQVYSFTLSDAGGVFPGRTWTFICTRIRPGRVQVGTASGTQYTNAALLMIVLENNSNIPSSSPGTTTLNFTVPTLPAEFEPYFYPSLSLPYVNPMSLEPSVSARFEWPHIRWSSPTSISMYIPSLASSNTVNVPTFGFGYLGTFV
jgi:hypothetical protein